MRRALPTKGTTMTDNEDPQEVGARVCRAFPTEDATTTDNGDMQEAGARGSSLSNRRDNHDRQRGHPRGGGEGVEPYQRTRWPWRTAGIYRRRRPGGRALLTEETATTDNGDLYEATARGSSITNRRDGSVGLQGPAGGDS